MKFRIAISLGVIAGTVIFSLRHREFRELKVEQEQLQSGDHVRQKATVPETSEVAATPAAASSGLSAEERSELLRLRGQLGALRQELARETSQLAKAVQAAVSDPGNSEPTVSRQEIARRMSDGKQWMVALMMYADDNQGRFPASLGPAAPFMGTNTTSADQFEFVPTGELRLSTLPRPSSTIVLREKNIWKGNNGRWNRIYAFADGHVVVAQSDSQDFSAWEEGAQKLPDAPPGGYPR
jgi:prepilin-type processing-associated H-X9-DG protein